MTFLRFFLFFRGGGGPLTSSKMVKFFKNFEFIKNICSKVAQKVAGSFTGWGNPDPGLVISNYVCFLTLYPSLFYIIYKPADARVELIKGTGYLIYEDNRH